MTTIQPDLTHRSSRNRPAAGRRESPFSSAGTEAIEGQRRIAVLFVAMHLGVIALFALPVDLYPLDALRSFFAPYVRCIGLNETWDTFAPRPKDAEQFLKAIVITRHGKAEIYTFPRMEDLSFFERYRKERYRKFSESILCKDCAGLWSDIETEIARRTNDPDDPPTRVILIKFESSIDPKTGATGDEIHAKPTVLAEQAIDPENLR